MANTVLNHLFIWMESIVWLSTPHVDTKLFPHIFKRSLFVSGINPFLYGGLCTYTFFSSFFLSLIVLCCYTHDISGTNKTTRYPIGTPIRI